MSTLRAKSLVLMAVVSIFMAAVPVTVTASRNISIAPGTTKTEIIDKDNEVQLDITVINGAIDIWILPTPIYANNIHDSVFTDVEEGNDMVRFSNVTSSTPLSLLVRTPKEYSKTIVLDERNDINFNISNDDEQVPSTEVQINITHRNSRGGELAAGVISSVLVCLMIGYSVFMIATRRTRTYEE